MLARNGTSRIARVFTLLLLSFALAAAVRADVEVYRAQYRTARELLPIAEVAMSEGGSVAVDANSNSLVLVGSQAEVSQALSLLQQQDQRLRSVLIEHEIRTQRDLEAAGFRIRWSVGGDSVRVGNVVPAPANSGAAIAAGAVERRGQASTRASVRVLEGSWGRIASGSDLLVPIGSRRNPDTAIVTAESGLEVRPRILGNGQIRLDLRPFQGSLGRGAVVKRSDAETTLLVENGETTVVGGIAESGEGVSTSFLSGAGQGRESEEQLMLVTATIDGASQ